MTIEVDIKRALELNQMMPHPEVESFAWLARQAYHCRKILEIGTCHGASTRAMLDNSHATIYCVDSWAGGIDTSYGQVPEDWAYQTFLENMRDMRKRLRIFKMYSHQAPKHLEGLEFDMVYIDADHSYSAVKQDIQNFAPFVREGGLLCGHDYEPGHPGCIAAVKELVSFPQKFGEMTWWTEREEGWLRYE